MDFKLMIFALFNAAMAFDFAQPRERLFTRGGPMMDAKFMQFLKNAPTKNSKPRTISVNSLF